MLAFFLNHTIFLRQDHLFQSKLSKFVQINWLGDGVPESKKGLFCESPTCMPIRLTPIISHNQTPMPTPYLDSSKAHMLLYPQGTRYA